MFLFNPEAAPRFNLADQLREEQVRECRLPSGDYSKDEYRAGRVETVDGVTYQKAGGGRRRLPHKSSSYEVEADNMRDAQSEAEEMARSGDAYDNPEDIEIVKVHKATLDD